ncbi:malate synthase A [Brachybacterium saurashtrense]|uniref:Malate synthase n=1 Tax=Brachybacterium saurashtrense TaxID=556288 RepID=A0A345YRT2_9MICO|nr:malate synthase A [Brachybacterium saurashtrense]AXK46634.1 malate synthase A [Brachybacterium saurashtrense]RRR20779.1 malate synthase A [Brachybacterium saurashtrense]
MTLIDYRRPLSEQRRPGASPTASGPSATSSVAVPDRRGRIEVTAPLGDRFEEILTPAALDFLALLHDRFAARRSALLTARAMRREAISGGAMLDFLPTTRAIRQDPTWRVAGAGPGLEDRRVEITGPTDRKMTINALNSGAKVWLADHEDALSPTWHAVIDGQLNLHDAIRRQVDFTGENGKEYRLAEETATIVFRPRGWHLPEQHLRWVRADGRSARTSAALVDAGLYLFHNARELIARGAGPYLYLPKLESHLEARLWDEVFTLAERQLGIDHGTIRATVLIETLPAAFEMEEILYELRDHCAGLNAGRWDYLFSIIKTFRDRGRRRVLPDRSQLTMTVPFMRAYTELLVATCHRRGAHAIGGMSAFVPDRGDPEVTRQAMLLVAEDKQREATDGFDGTWVAHPDLVPAAQAEFDAVLGERPHQVGRLREDVHVTAADLLDLEIDGGTLTAQGIRQNIRVSLRYLDAWLRGRGAVAIDHLMEDAATVEISRSQLWQWITQGMLTEEGMPVTRERVEYFIDRAVLELDTEQGGRIPEAAELLKEAVLGEEFPEFLTTGAYERHLQ